MYSLFIQTTLMVSLGVIVYLASLAVSRTSENNSSNGNGTSPNRRWGAILPLDEIDRRLVAVKDKMLRRLRVIIMKFDNFISKRLNNGG
jgi:hypothetical protein